MSWKSPAYVNPPFGQASKWFDKAVSEYRDRGVQTIMLIPFRPSARYIHRKMFVDKALQDVIVLTRGVKFEGYEKALATTIMLLIIGGGNGGIGRAPTRRIKTYMLTFDQSALSMERDVVPSLSRSVTPNIVVATDAVGDTVARILRKKHATTKTTTLVLVPARFHAPWFRDLLLPHALALFLISPDLTFGKKDAKKSFVGSVGVLIGGAGDGAGDGIHGIHQLLPAIKIGTKVQTSSRALTVIDPGGRYFSYTPLHNILGQ